VSDELTADQIAYCHELAQATRARWTAHARQMTTDEMTAMEKATRELDAEIHESLLAQRLATSKPGNKS
jgi:hypothetical protein